MNGSKKAVMTSILVVGFFFVSTPLQAQDTEAPKIYFKDGLHIDAADGKNTFHISARVQGRFTFAMLEGTRSTDTFAIQRGKIKLDGNVFSKKLAYDFQMNLATRQRATTTAVCADAGCTTTVNAVTTEGTTGLAVLEDFAIDYTPFDFFGIKVGQYKTPFLMQELTSSGRQQFVDRSLAAGFFNLQRDIGITLHGDILNYHVSYAVFAMNGDGANELNRNRGMLLGGRFEVPILGKYLPVESDVDYSETPNFGVGAAYAFNERVSTFGGGTIAANIKASHATIDSGFKYHGFSFQGAGMFSRTHEGTAVTNWGFSGQAGYFIIPKRFEVAVRSDGAVFIGATPNQYEHSVVLNLFVKGHAIKWQNDYALLQNNRGQGLTDHRIRSQVQVIF